MQFGFVFCVFMCLVLHFLLKVSCFWIQDLVETRERISLGGTKLAGAIRRGGWHALCFWTLCMHWFACIFWNLYMLYLVFCTWCMYGRYIPDWFFWQREFYGKRPWFGSWWSKIFWWLSFSICAQLLFLTLVELLYHFCLAQVQLWSWAPFAIKFGKDSAENQKKVHCVMWCL